MTREDVTSKDIFMITFSCIVLIIGVISHSVTALAFYLNRNIRKSTSNIIFLSVAIADSCIILWTVPISILSRLNGGWPWNYNDDSNTGPTCDFSGLLDNFSAVSLVWTLALYALDRLTHVLCPLKYEMKMTKRKAFLAMSAIWVYSICLSLPPVFGLNSYVFSKATYMCSIKEVGDTYFIIFFIGTFPIPLITICVSYFFIGVIARQNVLRTSHICETLYDGNQSLFDKAKTNIKSTIVVSAVISGSLVCTLPIFTLGMIVAIFRSHIDPSQEAWGIANTIGTLLFITGSCVNVIIFGLLNKQLREAIFRILRCKTRRYSERKKIQKQSMKENGNCRSRNHNSSTMSYISSTYHSGTSTKSSLYQSSRTSTKSSITFSKQ